MKSRWLSYLASGLVLYVVFLVATVPAKWVAWGIARMSNGVINLSQPSGGLWHGKGELVVLYPQATALRLGQTEWRVNPLWLFAGRLRLAIRMAGPTKLDGTVQLARRAILLQDTTAAFPADLAGSFYSPAALFSPKGQIRVNTAALEITDSGLSGDADIIWQGAGSKLSSVQPLGDYRLRVQGQGESASIALNTLRGDLVLTGRGEWAIKKAGNIQFVGNAKPRARRMELEPILRLLGKDQGGGQRPLVLKARLPLDVLPLF